MTTKPPTAGLSRGEWRMIALLVASILVNYIERSNLSVAAPALKTDLNLTEYELGKLLASFFWTYAGFQLFGLAGLLVDRFHVGWVLGMAYFVWSGATALTGVATGFATLFAMRLAVGLSESLAYPAYSKILTGNLPEHHRGVANALIDGGTKIGPALCTLAGGILIERFGWRAFFIGLGLGGMVWLVPWFLWMPRDRAAQKAQAADAPTLLEIMRQRPFLATCGGLFCGNYFWYFLLTWLPFYLVRHRGFSMHKMAVLGSLAYFAIGVSAVVSGWVSDRMVAHGAPAARVRRGFAAAGLALSTIILSVASVRGENAAMALLVAACMAFGIFSSNHWALTQTLAGPKAAGKWTSLENGVGNLAGVVSPWVTGAVVQWTGSFAPAFLLAGLFALGGMAMYRFGVSPAEQVAWKRRG